MAKKRFSSSRKLKEFPKTGVRAPARTPVFELLWSLRDLLIINGVGLFILAGCALAPLVQDGRDQPAAPPTPVKEQATATTAPIAQTSAPTSTRTSIPPTASPQVSTSIEEPFADNRNNWHTDSGLATIVEGKYSHKLECPDANISPQCGSFIRMPFTFPRSFRLEIEAALVKSSPGASVQVGFQVRRSDIHYYFISYSLTEGYYQMSYISQTGQFEIVPETSTGQIKTATGETNQLGIAMKGRLLTPLINGQELAPANHGKIPDAGDTYLVILITRGHSAELQLDNLTVQEVR